MYIASAVPIPYEPNRFTISPRPPGPRSRAWYSTRAGVACSDMNWHERFIYDSESGRLIWKPHDSDITHVGKRIGKKTIGHFAGTRHYDGYIVIKIKGKGYLAHRIIYEMHHGPIPPKMQIDHIDGNPQNDKVDNLRLATSAQNNHNKGKSPLNKSGLKGVFWCNTKKRWLSTISINGKLIHLGTFLTKGLAAVAYAKASLRYHGKFARIGNVILSKKLKRA